MRVICTISEIREIIREWKKEGFSVGFVPTMGYLHEGHKSLIEKASSENQRVVVSTFVNPTQFGANEDLNKYPRDLERDTNLCEKAGAHIMFVPSADEMYPTTPLTFVNVNILTEGLCGEKRPGHFQGVCSVVTKLFNIITPNRAYFGEKDAQQLAVIRQMVKDLNMDVKIIGCPIIRENDGLAKSSRNTYLSDEERKAALILNKSLKHANELLLEGEKNTEKIIESIKSFIISEPLAKIDYVQIVDSETLKSVDKIEKPVLIAIAVFIGKTRLIDNFTWSN
ncbi:pantothenate synthetase [Clostridium polyendosporum]|uniref:Pantothenate synthetase n=1 Tax=Clostridium polyendosporum TaxID=69208 RepID=A0A919S334_9CLOT|nr:pantoate--beta-alanine ligase [Clostridium polyendosporum]GIM30328.1 pantothenate synthetase [Clostridium polyendosporum]